MYDALGVLQASTTKTAAFAGTGFDLKTGTPHRGLVCRLRVTNFSGAGAGAVWTPQIEHSDDNTAYTTLVTGTAMTCTTAAGTSLQMLRFQTGKRYVRLAVALSPTTSAPTITYAGEIGLAAT